MRWLVGMLLQLSITVSTVFRMLRYHFLCVINHMAVFKYKPEVCNYFLNCNVTFKFHGVSLKLDGSDHTCIVKMVICKQSQRRESL